VTLGTPKRLADRSLLSKNKRCGRNKSKAQRRAASAGSLALLARGPLTHNDHREWPAAASGARLRTRRALRRWRSRNERDHVVLIIPLQHALPPSRGEPRSFRHHRNAVTSCGSTQAPPPTHRRTFFSSKCTQANYCARNASTKRVI
jgi:hypothetical protein